MTVAEDLLFAVMGCNGVWKAAALFIHNSRTATGGTGFEFWRASLPNVKITKTHIIWSITGQDSIVKFTKIRVALATILAGGHIPPECAVPDRVRQATSGSERLSPACCPTRLMPPSRSGKIS